MSLMGICWGNTKEGQGKVLWASKLRGEPSAQYTYRQTFQHERPQCERPSDDPFRAGTTIKQPIYKKSEGKILDKQVSSDQVRRKHEKIQLMQDMRKLQLYTYTILLIA